MGADNILELISKYSTTFVLAALAIYVGYKLVNIFIKKSEKQEDNENIRQKQLDEIYDRFLKAWDTKMNIDVRKQLSNDLYTDKIEKLLSQLLETCIGADRASLFMYHNGGHDMAGRSFQKMSCTNQFVKPGVASTQSAYQNMYKSSLHYITSKIRSDGFCYVDDLSSISDKDYSTYDILSQNGVGRIYARSIKDLDRTVIGFVAVTAATATKSFEETSTAKYSIDRVSSNIEGILTVKGDDNNGHFN